jgi:plasmid stabilization system protein ParE
MRIHWEDKAEWNLHQIEDYIFERFGPDSMEQFIDDVEQTVRMLMRYPNSGKIDPLFADRSITYRSVVISGLSKLVYYVEDDVIHIAAFWDTRREPKRQAAQTK